MHLTHKGSVSYTYAIQSLKDPTLRDLNLAASAPDGPFPLCSHCVVLLTERCYFKHRIGCAVVLACVVLFQAQCVGMEGIVLSSRGYCPRLMYACLFMLQASLSGR